MYARMMTEEPGPVRRPVPFSVGDRLGLSGQDAENSGRTYKKSTGRSEVTASYVHVTDAARAFVLALENPRRDSRRNHFRGGWSLAQSRSAKSMLETQP